MYKRQPYNPKSNGLAEAAVKNIKTLINRCHKLDKNLQLAIAAWRNMARTDSVSPSQLFFGRRQRQQLPLTAEQTKAQESSTACRDAMAGKSERYKNTHTSNYSELHPNHQVWMQHHVTGKWDTLVTVRKKREEGNSYIVCAQGGNTYIRGRRLLKPINHPQYLIPSRTPRTTSPKRSASGPKTEPKTTGAEESKKKKKKTNTS